MIQIYRTFQCYFFLINVQHWKGHKRVFLNDKTVLPGVALILMQLTLKNGHLQINFRILSPFRGDWTH